MVDSPTDGPEAPGAREVILLPVNLAGLADMVEKTGSNRYALQAVRLRADGRGGYTAEATDGIWYVRVVGSVADADTYPIPPALETAPNGADDVLVPAHDWKQVFKSVSRRAPHPIFKTVAAVLGENVTTLATSNGESTTVVQPCNVGGQFPDASNVFPARSPRAVLRVNADRLAKLTRFAGGFTDGGSVFLKVYDNGLPLVMEAENGGQHLVALLQTIHMPEEKPAE